ncbi:MULTISPECIES: hypothetical protein [unclassified Prochlorococcus]|uniref:hypothetical protein n=1 Tax=unclassified Prochlorococcus TaxID=2627481 RepID=UPI0005338186|nr:MULTISPECIES: hypothetical protein [unclassified Prochlorococcus]KGG16338.1 hypothetical protein EV07_1507 [Prochlorococcus sp. MIT 0603]KGG17928.1 hypothetical protein EV06_0051 [Prochlorococcus sp. MIT 0602]
MVNLDAFLLINTNNDFTKQAIGCLNNSICTETIKFYISTTEVLYGELSDYINTQKVHLILHKSPHKSLWRHMEWLSNYSKSDYITFLHDDDIFDRNYLQNSFCMITANKPYAYSNRTQSIDKLSNKLKNRKHIPRNKSIKLNLSNILNRYFLPFERTVDFPTITYKREVLCDYWRSNKLRNLSIFEDVRIVCYLASRGLFIEHKNSNLYSYRINQFQTSNIRNEIDRLRLISWLKKLKIARLYRSILVLSAKLQYLVYYKKPTRKNKYYSKFVFRMRNKLIKIRNGE